MDAALEMESQCRRQYDKQLAAAMADKHERTAASLSDLSPRRQVQAAISHLEASAFFSELYRAIKAAHAVNAARKKDELEERDYVAGVYSRKKRISVHVRREMPDAIAGSHGLWLDGTPNPDIWRRFFGPNPPRTDDLLLRVEFGPYHLTQYADRPYGKAFWRNKAHLDRLYRLILHRAAHHRGRTADDRVLVIVQKAVQAALEAKPLPANVVIHHFKAIRGLDGFKGCPCVIVAGRPMLESRDLEALAEALHFDDPEMHVIQSSEGRYHAAKRTLQTDRGPVTINAERLPDARAEALREHLVDSEVRQGIHRLRLFDRTQDNPAEIHVFGQVDTQLVVSQMADWQDAERSPAELMLSSGVVTTNEELITQAALGVMFGSARSTVQKVVGALKMTRIPFVSTVRRQKAKMGCL